MNVTRKPKFVARIRLTTTIAAFTLLSCFAAVPANAAGAKPPKSFCLHFTSGPNWIFASKSMGKVNTAAGTVTLYTVNGAADYGSAYYGSGYMGGTVLHAQLGTEVGGYSFRLDLQLNTASGTGNSVLAYTLDDGSSGGVVVDTVSTVDCATVTISGAP